MLDSGGGRVLGVALLVAVLFGLAVWYGTLLPAPEQGAYPSGSDLAADYDARLGQQVQLTGTVVGTDPVVIAVGYDRVVDGQARAGTVRFTVTGVGRPVAAGQNLQVYGTARPDRTIAARNVVTVPSERIVYMYAVSAVAGLWVLARILRRWRLDPSTGALVRRERPVDVLEALRARIAGVID